jgi:hypothetical protein
MERITTFEKGPRRTNLSTNKCLLGLPYAASDEYRSTSEFCQNCGGLLQQTALNGDFFYGHFESSPVFSGAVW